MAKNKKTTKKSHRTPFYQRPVFVVGIILVLLAIAGAVIFFSTRESESAEPTPETPTTSEEKPDHDADLPIVGGDADTGPFGTSDGTDDKTDHYEGEDPNTLNSLTGSVSYATVRDSTLSIGAMIDQFISGGGICVLTLQGEQKGGVYKSSVDTIAGPSNSYCDTFQVPTSELLPNDYYQIKIEVTGGGKTGIIEGGVQL